MPTPPWQREGRDSNAVIRGDAPLSADPLSKAFDSQTIWGDMRCHSNRAGGRRDSLPHLAGERRGAITASLLMAHL